MRHASDTIHGWARHLVIGDARAKSVLLALCLYADHRAIAWPSIATLAADTEQSENTIRSRLKYLDEIGVIARLPRWSDDAGIRNAESRGRRTSDDIQLATETTQESIDAARAARKAARGSRPEPLDETSTEDIEDIQDSNEPEGRGSNCGPPQPEGGRSTCVDPYMNSQLRKEESPLTPKGEWGHEKSWKKFEETWGEPILHQKLCREIWGKLTDAERELVTVAAAGYVAWRRSQRRPPPVCNAQKFLREREAWPGYAARAPNASGAVVAIGTALAIDSPEGRAHAALCRIAHTSPLEIGGAYRRRAPLSVRGLALAAAPPEEDWIFIAADQRAQCAAWNELLVRELPGINRPQLVWDRNPGHRSGFLAPYPWPPNVKGEIYASGDSTGPPPDRVEGTLMTRDDLDVMAKG